jgi:hypothetical protein
MSGANAVSVSVFRACVPNFLVVELEPDLARSLVVPAFMAIELRAHGGTLRVIGIEPLGNVVDGSLQVIDVGFQLITKTVDALIKVLKHLTGKFGKFAI